MDIPYVYVEIELDGLITTKRCPDFRTPEGLVDESHIRRYFEELGYRVGQHVQRC